MESMEKFFSRREGGSGEGGIEEAGKGERNRSRERMEAARSELSKAEAGLGSKDPSLYPQERCTSG